MFIDLKILVVMGGANKAQVTEQLARVSVRPIIERNLQLFRGFKTFKDELKFVLDEARRLLDEGHTKLVLTVMLTGKTPKFDIHEDPAITK